MGLVQLQGVLEHDRLCAPQHTACGFAHLESLPAPAWGQTDVLHHVMVLGHPSAQLGVSPIFSFSLEFLPLVGVGKCRGETAQ